MPMIQLYNSATNIKSLTWIHLAHTAFAPPYDTLLLSVQQLTAHMTVFNISLRHSAIIICFIILLLNSHKPDFQLRRQQSTISYNCLYQIHNMVLTTVCVCCVGVVCVCGVCVGCVCECVCVCGVCMCACVTTHFPLWSQSVNSAAIHSLLHFHSWHAQGQL